MARKKWQPWKQYFELVKVEKEPSTFGKGGTRTVRYYECCWCKKIVRENTGVHGAENHFWHHPEAQKVMGNPYNLRPLHLDILFGRETIAAELGTSGDRLLARCKAAGLELPGWPGGCTSSRWLYKGYIALLAARLLRSETYLQRASRLRVGYRALKSLHRYSGRLPAQFDTKGRDLHRAEDPKKDRDRRRRAAKGETSSPKR